MLMPIEGWVDFFSDTAGVKQEKGVSVIYQTIEVNGYQVSNIKKQ